MTDSNDERGEGSPKVRLYEGMVRDTKSTLDAYFGANGDLILSGCDLGDLPERVWGDSDYEYWLRIPAEQKDLILLYLLEDTYKGNPSASTQFREWLKQRGIPCTFGSWI